MAGFARVDHTLEEAAADLGARPRQVLLRATLPQMRATLVAAAAFSFIISFDELDATIFLVGQTSNTLPTAMFIYMQKYQDPTLAALSSLLDRRVAARGRRDRGAPGADRRRARDPRRPVGRGRGGAGGRCMTDTGGDQ